LYLASAVVVFVVCSSRVGLKLDNSKCESQCLSTKTAAQFISQSLHEGHFKPVTPIKSVKGRPIIALTVSLETGFKIPTLLLVMYQGRVIGF